MDDFLNPSSPNIKNPEIFGALLKIENQEKNQEAKANYIKSYLLSFCLPPGGIYYFIKLTLFSEESSAKKAGVICLVLTIFSLILNFWIISQILNQVEDAVENSQKIEVIKELITPKNQKDLLELLK